MSALFVAETSLQFLFIKNRDERKSGLAAILFPQTVKHARTKADEYNWVQRLLEIYLY